MLDIMYNTEVSKERNKLIDCARMTLMFPFVCHIGDDSEDKVNSVYSFKVTDEIDPVDGTGFNNYFNSLVHYTLKKVTEDERDFTPAEMDEQFYYGLEGWRSLERANDTVAEPYKFTVLTDETAKKLVESKELDEICKRTGCRSMLPKYREMLQYCYDIVKRI